MNPEKEINKFLINLKTDGQGIIRFIINVICRGDRQFELAVEECVEKLKTHLTSQRFTPINAIDRLKKRKDFYFYYIWANYGSIRMAFYSKSAFREFVSMLVEFSKNYKKLYLKGNTIVLEI